MQGVRSKELESRCRLLAERLTECTLVIDHDPSLALYRLHEHMNRSLPVLVKAKLALAASSQRMVHVQRDLENAVAVGEGMERAGEGAERAAVCVRECMQLRKERRMDRSTGRSKSFHGRSSQSQS